MLSWFIYPYAWKVPAREIRFRKSKQNMQDVITHACTNFNDDLNKPPWAWMSNYIPQFYVDVTLIYITDWFS